jgi:hypothetical protein
VRAARSSVKGSKRSLLGHRCYRRAIVRRRRGDTAQSREGQPVIPHAGLLEETRDQIDDQRSRPQGMHRARPSEPPSRVDDPRRDFFEQGAD